MLTTNLRPPLALLVAVLGACGSQPPPESAIPGVSWSGDTIVATDLPLDVDLLDARLVNVVLEHALNSGRVDSRNYYCGDDPSRVVLVGDQLPEGLFPEVAGVEFIAWSPDMRDGLEPGEGCLRVSFFAPTAFPHDLVVGFRNIGGRTAPDGRQYVFMGGAASYYDVDRSGSVLRVRYMGTFDP